MSRRGKASGRRGAAPERPGAAASRRRSGERRGGGPPGRAWREGAPRLRLLFGGVVVLAQLALAVGAFNPAPHTGGDNAAYVSLAHSLVETGTYTDLYDPEARPHTKYPPVFPALLALWILLGATSWVVLKTTAVLFSTLAVLFAYLWASERRGPVFGAAVALLLALSSVSVEASHWILSEPPFLAFTLLALWAFERGRRDGDGGGEALHSLGLFTLLGGAAAVLAYFTRSAGLPLLVAVAAWLAWRRRWRALGLFGAGAGAPVLLWLLRARLAGEPTYLGEFWMVDPYDPARGRIGLLGLVGRFGENLVQYLTRHVPGGIVGDQGTWVAALGVLLAAAALVGWALRATRDAGVAELFLPLYAGLILLWPPVWAGDRFALPLYPLLFFYAGEAVVSGAARLGRRAVPAAATVAFLALALPAFGAWRAHVSVARFCAAAARTAGPWGCYGPAVGEFVRVALWSRSALPEGSAVFSRKPRIFYAMSGVPSRTFPFSSDPDLLLAEARATGARYVVLDQWDRQALRYVGEAVARRPAAFCAVGGFGPEEGGVGTLILGIFPDAPGEPDAPPEPALTLERCPPEMLGDASAPVPAYLTGRVPLLVDGRAEGR